MDELAAIEDAIHRSMTAAVEDDPEAAHGAEDEARERALRWIAAHGDSASAALATIALRTAGEGFPRWAA